MDAATGTTIASVASTVGVVLVAYIAYRQAQLNKKVDVVQEQTNGILIAATAAKAKAEGKSEAVIAIAPAVVAAVVAGKEPDSTPVNPPP